MEEKDELVKFMKHKYCVALALAVIKYKPPDTSVLDFCHALQTQLKACDEPCTYNEIDDFNIATDAFEFEKSQLTDHFSNEVGDTTQNKETSDKIKLIKQNVPQIWDAEMERKMHKFNILRCLKNIKDIVCMLNGSSSYSGIFSKELDQYTNTTSTQESGYQSASQSNIDSQLIAHKNNNFEELDKSIFKIISFICESPEEDYSHSVLDYISDVLGRSFDILDTHNISITSSDRIVEEILDIINSFSSNEKYFSTNKDFYHQCLVRKFGRLTKATLFIKFSLCELANELQRFQTKVNNSQTASPIEYTDVNYIYKSFYTFQLLEIVIKQLKKNEKQMPHSQNLEENNSKSTKQFDVLDVWRKNWVPFQKDSQNILQNKTEKPNETLVIKDVLNEMIIECIDSYPLISFWAVECLNHLEGKSEI